MTEHTPLRGQLIEEETLVTLDELCGACTVRSEATSSKSSSSG